MRHPWSIFAAGLCLAGTLTLGACATSSQAANRSEQTVAQENVQVQVQNNLVPPIAVTVWIVPRTGVKKMLGSVNPGATSTFDYSSTNALPFVLEARTTGGTNITSRQFTITAGTDQVAWDLHSNTVSIGS